MRAIRIFTILCIGWISIGTTRAQPQAAVIRGKVMDSATGEPISKATVSIRERKIETRTSDAGEFELLDVAPGEVELYVTTVGFGLVRQRIEVAAGSRIDVDVLLGPEILRRTEEINVTENPFLPLEPASVSDHFLTQRDMRNLTSVLMDDPLRSVQSLPGVTTGDDLYAQFSARGAGFRSIGYATDGFLLRAPLYEVGDINDGGSLSMLNGEVIEALTFSAGPVSAKYGDRTAGYLNITTREGSRRQVTNTGAASATGISWITEGPIGGSKKASWLFAARKSYLDWLINGVADDPSTAFVLGFKDFFAKLSFEPVARHQFRISATRGNSRVDQQRDRVFNRNSFLYGDSDNQIAIANWLWVLSGRLTLDSAISYDNALLKNVNHDRELLFRSVSTQVAFKQDMAYHSGRSKIEAGYLARRLNESTERWRFQFASQRFVTSDRFAASEWQPGAYAQQSITAMNSRLAFTYGGRFDRFTLTGQNVWMPRASLAYSFRDSLRVTAAFGQYSQFPSYFQMLGQFGNPDLHAERATHYTLQLEHLINDKTRIRVEAYNREDRSGVFSVDTEYRLVNGQIVGPRPGAAGQYQNSLRGRSRGLEMLIERRSVNKLSGWISYSYGVARYRDATTNLSFYGDFDQRHTFNVYATYRLKPTLNLSAKYRYGSNFPVPGFLSVEGKSATLSDQRNVSRVPRYSRLDLRANKAFNYDRWKLTVYGEVLNVLARRNVRSTVTVDTVNRSLSVDTDSMFPVLPIAGLRIEF
jgi:outer membrane receptor for ferrienterochelin and colicin